MTSTSVAYAAGRSAWLDGEPMVPMPPNNAPLEEHQFFLGYMREVARDYVMRVPTTASPPYRGCIDPAEGGNVP